MQTTRRELLDDFLGFVTEQGDSIARDIAERALNRALLALWMKRAWNQFRHQTPHQLTTVAGTRDYVLPRHFGRMAYADGRIRNVTTGGWLFPITREELDEQDPTAGTSLASNGLPIGYLQDNTVGVAVQPLSTGEACEVVSDSAADVAVRVYVEGLDQNGVSRRVQVTLTGTNPVAVGTWSRIELFGKSYPDGVTPTSEFTSSAGTVTLRTAAGPVTLQSLLSDESAVDLPVLTLYPTPDAAYTYAVPYLRAPRTLKDDAEPLPRFWGNALFEELQAQWHVNKGNIASDAQIPRPALADLIAMENASAVPFKARRRPFGGR